MTQQNLPFSLPKISGDLRDYIESEGFKGYDPYDTLNSWLPFQVFGKWGRPIAIQIQKRNPINIRPFIGISKDYNPKAIGLLLQTYSILQRVEPSKENEEKMKFCFEWLLNNRTTGFDHYCWGYNFDWASSVKLLKAYSPTIVVSGFIAKGLIEYYKTTKDEKAIEVLTSIGEFILNDLPRSEDNSGICFSYSTIEKDCCYNASMLGSELFAFLYHHTGQDRYKELATSSSAFVVDKQLPNGCWNYSINLETGKERKQIDFHQGYVIDSLSNVAQYIPDVDQNIIDAIEKGIQFYAGQFLDNGQSLYRYPTKWPVDIHNQAQGIITFSKASHSHPDYLDKAIQIADYTVNKMKSTRGYFYYKKYPWITIKTPFMRWGQAWMFLALTELKTAYKERR